MIPLGWMPHGHRGACCFRFFGRAGFQQRFMICGVCESACLLWLVFLSAMRFDGCEGFISNLYGIVSLNLWPEM